jgi:exopolysaccharide biosynthesis polyprenyl glycosylphosphotransferase
MRTGPPPATGAPAPQGAWPEQRRLRRPRRAVPPPVRQVVAARYGRRDAGMRRLLALADAAGVLAGVVVMAAAGSPGPPAVAWGALAIPGWIVVFKAYGLYDRDMKRIGHGTVDDLPWVFHGMLVGSLLLWLWFRIAPAPHVPFSEITTLFAAPAGLAVLALRAIARRAGARWLGPERVLLVGDGEQLAVVARKMRSHAEYDVEPVGFLSRTDGPAQLAGLPLLGMPADPDFAGVVSAQRIDRVVIAHSAVADEILLDVLRRCRELGVKASVLPQLFDVIGPSVEVDDVEGVTMLGIAPPVFPRSSRLLKRTMDQVGAAALLMLGAPVFGAIAVAIKLDSPGPVLFRQERIGRGGRPFELLKFRTMELGAELRHEELRSRSSDPGWLMIDDDPRITRIGRLLRHASLDELPQLWNVLRGEMSLVGPRPLMRSEDRQLDGWRRARVDLTPGLTGLWQVLGRTRIPFEEMVKLDYLYVTNWSLWDDVRLMLRTLPAVIRRRGAN